MKQRLTKCVRCNHIFVLVKSRVCPTCQHAEDKDFDVVREVLDRHPGISPEDLVEASGVKLDCVMRLLAEGRIQAENFGPPPKCGRCNAMAISHTLRLCVACHTKINRECGEAIRAIQAQIQRKPPSSLHKTHEMVEQKREAYGARIARLVRPTSTRNRGNKP